MIFFLFILLVFLYIFRLYFGRHIDHPTMAAKAIFRQMTEDGICRASSSTVMTFSLRNRGHKFQRYIHRALGNLDFVFAFIDDILIASSNLEEHESHLKLVFSYTKKF